MLLRQVDRKLGLLERLAPFLPDDRDPTRVGQRTPELLRWRVYEIVPEHEDLNDHQRRCCDGLHSAGAAAYPRPGRYVAGCRDAPARWVEWQG
ncbi:MAG: transposase [Pseudogulbenkiania sp.]|nr:transposase [Pseudogulbenkiania sp.]